MEERPTAKERLERLLIGWVDHVYRRLHGKEYLPPWSLRFTVGSPSDFEVTGAEFSAYLKLLCGLTPQHHVLDIGCGCGMMALRLMDFISGDGLYSGMDVDQRAIAWCQTHITPRNPRLTFYHADLKNLRYNSRGALAASSYRFPEPDACFDVILLKSVFTHMQREGVGNYLDEIARLLKPGGRCLATFFLFDDDQTTFTQWDGCEFSFGYGDQDSRYENPTMPEKAVAYREGFVRGLLRRSRLVLTAPPYYGTWSGRPDGLSFQDIVILSRE
jgi:SAM-dependent methyltransferase